jgi:hypothetical protein
MEINPTQKSQSSPVLIYIIIIVVVVGLLWIANNNNSEKFANDNPMPEIRTENRHNLRRFRPQMRNLKHWRENESEHNSQSNSQTSMNDKDIDEYVRRQAIATHQIQLAEMEQEEERKRQLEKSRQSGQTRQVEQRQLAASVPPMHQMDNIKPFEPEDSTLLQFAKDTQYIVDKYRPNDMYKKVPTNNGSFYELTADDRTIALMNQVDDNKDINDVACNLSNSLSESDKDMISSYKNKYYNMYAHQINCSNGSGNLTGCGKRCYANAMSPSKCNDQTCYNSMDELNNGPDFVSLNQLILEKNNSRPCSTCTQGQNLSRAVGVQNILDQVSDMDNVSKSFMDSQVMGQNGVSGTQENFTNLSRELMNKDTELAKKKKVSFANVNNFANFNNYIAQNGVLETSVDKMAEIRSNVTNNATCELNKYGQSISEVYDNLMKNPYMQYKKSCDTAKITGIMDDNSGDYANL